MSVDTDQTVLIVETDLKARHMLAEYLRGCGYRTYEATDSDEAWTIVQAHRHEIDVVLCDVHCAGRWNGFELARQIREAADGIDILLVAGPEKAVEKVEGLCDDGPRLTKPYHPQTLLKELKRLKAARK